MYFRFVSKTTEANRGELDLSLARYIYATNTPFSHVEHATLMFEEKFLTKMRPSYQPPDRHRIGGYLLEAVHRECVESAKTMLAGKWVTLSLDGWTNANNESLVCIDATTTNGDAYLLETRGLKEMQHTAENLKNVVEETIVKFENVYDFNVSGFVTDNTGNVVELRRRLTEDQTFGADNNVVMYGCSANQLNLLVMT